MEQLTSSIIKESIARSIVGRIEPGDKFLDIKYARVPSISKDSTTLATLDDKTKKAREVEKGTPSPTFNYENYLGGKTSLADLRGKYVYIDIWATWCSGCILEIPYLKKIEKDLHNENIEFASISIDREKDYERWRKMVADKELTGIQLIADKQWDSAFTRAYNITHLPRFIIIDPDGNIVEPNALLPSEPKLITYLQALLAR
jgi:thiol-disulfide isomerase/thioredoxin